MRVSFEVLREHYENKKIKSFVTDKAQSTGDAYNKATANATESSRQSWEYYAEAAATEFPTYRCEPARSGRSSCGQTGAANKHGDNKLIPQVGRLATIVRARCC